MKAIYISSDGEIFDRFDSCFMREAKRKGLRFAEDGLEHNFYNRESFLDYVDEIDINTIEAYELFKYFCEYWGISKGEVNPIDGIGVWKLNGFVWDRYDLQYSSRNNFIL